MRDVDQMELHLQSHLQAMQQLAGGPVGGSGGPMVGGSLVGGGMVLDGMEQAAHLTVDAISEGMIRPNQLTLSFQGQLYVFDSVSTAKAHSVLRFLGGQELPQEDRSVHFHQDHKVLNDVPLSSNGKHRQASLMRFKEKRKDRFYEKKVRYQVRKDVAQRMQRKKGQFMSSKVSSEDLSSTPTHSNLSLGSCREQVQHETFGQHCGCSQISTSLMRRGPGGPKSLCNTCVLGITCIQTHLNGQQNHTTKNISRRNLRKKKDTQIYVVRRSKRCSYVHGRRGP